MDLERTIRWTASVLFLVALVGLAYTAGVTVTPAVGWGLLALVSGAAAVRLTVRELDRREDARIIGLAPKPEPWAGAPTSPTAPDSSTRDLL